MDNKKLRDLTVQDVKPAVKGLGIYTIISMILALSVFIFIAIKMFSMM